MTPTALRRIARLAAVLLLAGGLAAMTQIVSARSHPVLAGPSVPVFRVNDVRVSESAGAVQFTVTITAAANASVQYSTVDGTAHAPVDYTGSNGTVTFTADGGLTQTVSVPLVDDRYKEAFETLSLQLSSPSFGAAIADAIGVATIVDDDGLPAQLSVGDVVSASEGSAAVFTIAVAGTLDEPAVVSYTTVKGTAVSPADFATRSGNLTLQPGQDPSATVSVPVKDDTVPEGTESFSLKVTTATNVTVADATGVARIPPNDGGTGRAPSAAPRVSVNDVRVPEGGGTASFTVSLTSPADAAVQYATPASMATATATADYTKVSGTLAFSAAGPTWQTIEVPIANDFHREFFEVVQLQLSSPSGAVMADSLGTATIVDDDGLPSQLVVSDVDQPVPEGSTADFSVSLADPPDEAVTATVATVPGSAGRSDFGSPMPATVTFAAGATDLIRVVSVPIVDDGVSERPETFSLQVTSAANADLADPVGTATIAGVAFADPVIAAAGDIACDPASSKFNAGAGTAAACRQRATSDLVVGTGLDGILTLGDNQYSAGTLAAFEASYDPSWGRALGLTHPAPGNHEYYTAGASGYYAYFGAAAGDPDKGYYSYDIGSWHLIALNSECAKVGGCGGGSPQESWLRADLAAHPTTCTLAYWHQPRFSSGGHGNNAVYDGFWRALYAAGADLVLNGHDHDYERFAPQTPSADPQALTGIREFVVGTGGAEHYPFATIRSNSEVRNADTYGVLRLTLHPTSYDWEFDPESGKAFTDSGTSPCV